MGPHGVEGEPPFEGRNELHASDAVGLHLHDYPNVPDDETLFGTIPESRLGHPGQKRSVSSGQLDRLEEENASLRAISK
jgi:hypothetical protein